MRHNCLRMPQNTDLDGLRQWVITADGYYINAIGLAVILYALPHYWKQPYNTLALTGASWVVEFMYGHPDCIWTALGMCLHVFVALVLELQLVCGLGDS